MKQTNKDLLHQKTRRSMRRKGNLRQVLFVFTLLAFFASSFLPAFASITLGSLTGKVLNKTTGKPVANAFVVAKGLGQTFTSTTDTTGYFSFVDMEPGTYSLKISRVGYQTVTVTDIPVTANSTVYESYKLMPAVYKVKGITVSGYQSQTVNPRETMTYYQFSKHELSQLLPSVQSFGINNVLDELPGVENLQTVSPFSLFGPHVRGGTGLGTQYAIDGIPIINSGLFNNLGNVGLTTGLLNFQFYPGNYPVQYGNGIDGYVNEIIPEGFGKIHGSLQTSFGFWLDANGNQFPIFNGTTGDFVGYSSQGPQQPNDENLVLQGQVKNFHYYLNYIALNGGTSGYENPDVILPNYDSSLGYNLPFFRSDTRDLALNLNYDLDTNNNLQFLWMNGYTEGSSNFFGTYPLSNPASPNISQTSGPAGGRALYDMESLGYTHHFSPGKAMTFRVWQLLDNPDQIFVTPPLYYFEGAQQRDTGTRLDFRLEMNPQNTVTVGGQYIYTNSYGTYAYVPTYSPYYLAYGIGESFDEAANTQYSSAWINDDWTPTPKWDINVGLRYDRMNYQPLQGLFNGGPIYTQANGLPFAANTFTGFSPDPASLSTSCTSIFNICVGSGTLSPSYVQPRISASYRVTHKFTVKAGYGEFTSFPIVADANYLSNLCAPGTGIGNPDNGTGTDCVVGAAIGGKTYDYVSLTTGGNQSQTGSDYDLSFEYMLNRNSFVKVTPFYKTENNPLIFSFIPTAETGGDMNAKSLTSKGVEVVLHTRNWHGLMGTLDYTYLDSKIIGNPGYALAYLSPIFFLSNVLTGTVVQPNVLYGPGGNGPALYNQQLSASVPTDWDIPNTVNLLLDYKPNKRWEIAPNFTYASGEPYGLGANNLYSIYQNLCLPGEAAAGTVDCPATFSANGETTPNTLRAPSEFLGNLAVTYHAAKWFSTTFTILNLFNNSQVLSYNSTPTVAGNMTFLGPAEPTPDYSPLKGQYAPLQIENIRQYWVTTTFHF